MYALVVVATEEKLATLNRLPSKFRLPDGGVTLLSEAGQEVPAHKPAYRVVERVIVSDAPQYPFIVTEESERVSNGRVEVTQTYTPDVGSYEAALDAHVESVARQKQYSSAVSCASYVASTNTAWQAEAQAFIKWRDDLWAYAFGELSKAERGQREIPTIDGFLAELPVIQWP